MHHKACDCREAATRKLVSELLEAVDVYTNRRGAFTELYAEAVRLGYVQGQNLKMRNNYPACTARCSTANPHCDRAFARCTATKPAPQGEGEG